MINFQNGHSPRQLVKAVINDLLSSTPTYTYDLTKLEPFRQSVGILQQVRQHNGLDAARLTFESLKERDHSFADVFSLPELFPVSTPAYQEPTIPALPEEAVCPIGLLPQVSPWLTTYQAFSRRLSPEGYEDFHVSCGLWLLSTVAARRIYVPLADSMYTPLAVALVARTSLFAKTTTAKAGIRVLKAANLHWLLGDDETTPQKLLADMAGHVPANYEDMTDVQRENLLRRVAMSGQLGWYYDEFNQLINAMMRPGPMQEFAGLLRKLDGCPDDYRVSTRAHGQDIIEKPYLALLANTTPANINKFASKGGEFWNDGFWARFAFICPPAHAWKTETMEVGEVPVPEMLVSLLCQWNRRLGVPSCSITSIQDDRDKPTGRYQVIRDELPSTSIHIDSDAYNAYNAYRIALRQITAESHNQDLDGSYTRLADKALRIAALIASLERNSQIDFAVWSVAQEITEMFRKNLHELYCQVNISQEDDENPLEDVLVKYLKSLQGKPTTIREIVRQAPSQLRTKGSEQVEKLLKYLEKSGVVQSKKEGRKELWELSQ
jgi:hypothetical protein